MKEYKYLVDLNPTNVDFCYVKLPKSENELKDRLYMPREQFTESAKARFNKLDKDYAERKSREELFPIVGNCQIGIGLANYIASNRKKLERLKSIKVVDIGAAGGAITSLFLMKHLLDFGLLDKVELHLVDIAHDALMSTKKGNFSIPSDVLRNYGFSPYDELEPFKKKLLKAEIHVATATDLPDILSEADIVVSGFTHHHMNLEDKEKSCLEIIRIAKKRAFIGLTDESLSLKDYIKWYKEHENEVNSRNERVPIALESFISLNDHIGFFENELNVIGRHSKSGNQREHYTFYGVKK